MLMVRLRCVNLTSAKSTTRVIYTRSAGLGRWRATSFSHTSDATCSLEIGEADAPDLFRTHLLFGALGIKRRILGMYASARSRLRVQRLAYECRVYLTSAMSTLRVLCLLLRMLFTRSAGHWC